jgi:hypothetical protein
VVSRSGASPGSSGPRPRLIGRRAWLDREHPRHQPVAAPSPAGAPSLAQGATKRRLDSGNSRGSPNGSRCRYRDVWPPCREGPFVASDGHVWSPVLRQSDGPPERHRPHVNTSAVRSSSSTQHSPPPEPVQVELQGGKQRRERGKHRRVAQGWIWPVSFVSCMPAGTLWA